MQKTHGVSLELDTLLHIPRANALTCTSKFILEFKIVFRYYKHIVADQNIGFAIYDKCMHNYIYT